MSNSSLNRKVKINLPGVKLSTTAKNLSLKQLLLFGLIFAGIGGYFLWQALAATNLPTRHITSPPDSIGYWVHNNSPTTQTIGTDGNGFRQRMIVWDTAGGMPSAFYSGRKTYGVFGFRLVEGNPGRMFNWHTQPNDQPWSWTPPCSGGGVSPLAFDYWADSRGFQAVVQPQAYGCSNPSNLGPNSYHYTIFSQSEMEALRGQWVWLWMELTWGRHDLTTKGALKVWIAGENTPRVNVSPINTHYAEQHQVTFLEGQYHCSTCSDTHAHHETEIASTRFGRTPKEAYEDVPVFFSGSSTNQSGGVTNGSSFEITPRLSTEAAIPLSLQWSTTTPAPTVSLSANPTSISSGASSTLTWSSANATSCTASGAWSGTKSTSGTQAITPTPTSIYTLTCTGSGGSATASATVTVSSTITPTPTFISSITDGNTVANGTVWTGSSTPAGSSMEFWSDGIMLSTDPSAPFEQVINLSVDSHRLGLCTWISGVRYCYPGGVIATINVVDPSDTTAPSTPTNLGATTSAYNRVDLSWSASTDNVGVSGYYIVRGGTTIAQTTTTATTYADTTVNASTSYTYQVIARDGAGNNSLASNTASATTPSAPDTTPPSTPTNLGANAVSSSQINLSWNASTDNVGVAGYDIYRNGTKIASATTTSYGDTGLAANTSYSYYVIAKDAAGNQSASSNTAAATTQPTLSLTGNLTGDIDSSTGSNIPGHPEISLNVSGATRTYKATSQGFYYIPGLPANTYQVNYKAKFHSPATQSTTITSNATTTLNVILQRL